MTTEQVVDAIDFALAAYRQGGEWHLDEMTHDHVTDLETLVVALRRFPAESGPLGMVAVDEDFFVLVRVTGTTVRLLLSDVTAADEWPLALEVADQLNLPLPVEDDEPAPAGDLDIVGDLGMDAAEMGSLLDDQDLYPDEMLSEVASQIGFGELFDEVVGLETA